jgi:hypothetical protein
MKMWSPWRIDAYLFHERGAPLNFFEGVLTPPPVPVTHPQL